MIVKAIKTEIFQERQNLPEFLFKYLPELKDGDMVVVTSKIVSIADGRVVAKENSKTREVDRE